MAHNRIRRELVTSQIDGALDLTEARMILDRLANYYDFACEAGSLKACSEFLRLMQVVEQSMARYHQVAGMALVALGGPVQDNRPQVETSGDPGMLQMTEEEAIESLVNESGDYDPARFD